MNFNNLKIRNREGPDVALSDHSVQSHMINVHFRDLEKHLIRYIRKADAVLGCVAWLSNLRVLDVLAEKEFVQFVVQKGDLWRADRGMQDSQGYKKKLAQKYKMLRCDIEKDLLVGSMSYCADPGIGPVRCMGVYREDEKVFTPQMHNKFLLFADFEEHDPDDEPISLYTLTPYAVWTGSFNITQNATYSFENAVYIANPEIVDAYFEEYSQILAISESLDWQHEWVAPERRIWTYK
jgi:hypothetical protein